MPDLKVAQVDRPDCVIALLSCLVFTANDADVDIVEAAKNLMLSIGGILSSTGAATLQVIPKRKPRMSMQANRSNLREEKRRQTSVDVKALKQALEAKGRHSRVVIPGMQYCQSLILLITMTFCNCCSPTPRHTSSLLHAQRV